jgi:enoyl-[acyl-carrier protein] reductase I
MNMPVFPETNVALKGKKGLIVGIANDQSIAWGCAKAFRALGADLAVTYLNEKAKKHVGPLAQALEAPIFMPLDVMAEGEIEKVFEQIEKEWGHLDFLLHSIAFSPNGALHGRVVDVSREGFQKTMDVSCWSFMRMACLAEPLMKNGGTIFTMTSWALRKRRSSRRCAISRQNSAPRAFASMPFHRDRWRRAQPQVFPSLTN